jgi:hypothetical protein
VIIPGGLISNDYNITFVNGELTIIPITAATVFSSGATTVCQDAPNETYTATSSTGSSITYSLFPPEAGVINETTGEMNWDEAFIGSVTITATSTGMCGTTSADRLVTVKAPSIGGTVDGGGLVCSGSNNTTLTLSGETGSVVKWQSSVNNWVNSTDIEATTNTLNITNLTFTTKYRAVVMNGECSSAYSASETLTVNPLPTAVLSGSASISGGTSTNLSVVLTGTAPWEVTYTDGTTPFTVSVTNTTSLISVSPLTTRTYNLVSVSDAYCSATSLTGSATITVASTDIWLGTTSTDWHTVSNWSVGEIPTASQNVVIPSGGNQPLIGSAAVCSDIIINSGAVLTIGASGTLTVSGTITNNSGISGLVLLSDATGTASLLHNTDNVQATVDRYISGNAESWHFLSSPVEHQDISGEWLPEGSYSNGTGYDLYLWDEPSSNWIYKLNTSLTINWNTVHPESYFVPERGYLYSVQELNPVKHFTGILNNGFQSIAVTNIGTKADLNGFNLVGNPYPSSIDWQAESGWTRSDLLESGGGYDMWIWSNEANNYGVQNSAAEIGTNGVTRYIPPMQGFLVRAQSDGNLLMDNSLRVNESAGTWLRKGVRSDINLLSITVNSADALGFDEIQLMFGSKQNEAGARKLFSYVSSAPSLFLPVQQEKYSVRYLTNTVDNPEIPIMFKAGADGDYTLHFNGDLSQYETVILEDRQLHYNHDLKANNEYSFKSLITDNQSRFVLHFSSVENPGNAQLPANVYQEGDKMIVDLTSINLETEIRIYDIMGHELLHENLQGETRNSLSVNSKTQLLIVVLKNQSGLLSKKLIWINR